MANQVMDKNGFWVTAIGCPNSLERAKSRGYRNVKEMQIEDTQCEGCGYTRVDARIHMDHHLCTNQKAPWCG